MSQLQHHHLSAPLLLSPLSHSTILWRLLLTFLTPTMCRRMLRFQQLGCSMWSSFCSLYSRRAQKRRCSLAALPICQQLRLSESRTPVLLFVRFSPPSFSVLPKRLPCQPQPLHCFAFNFGVLQWRISSFLLAKTGQLYCSPFMLVGKQLRF